MGHINMLMVQNMKVSSKIIGKMVLAKKHGLMEQSMKEVMIMELNMEQADFNGQMDRFMKAV